MEGTGGKTFPPVPLHLEASKRLIRHLQIIPKALGMVPVGLIEKHEQDRKLYHKIVFNENGEDGGIFFVNRPSGTGGTTGTSSGSI